MALKSVLEQPLDNPDDIEVVIVDDGSTDGSSQLADELAETDSRIRVFHQENQWVYAAFNRGVREAKGEYVYILNSDDRLEEGSIPILIQKLQDYNHPDVIWTKVIMCDADLDQNVISKMCESDAVTVEEYIDSPSDIHRKWLFLQETNLAQNQANLYKRELMLHHPFRNDVYAGDIFFNYDIAKDITSMLIITESIYDYFHYNVESKNISMYKYYAYEHEMFSELLDCGIKLYQDWNIEEEYYLDFLVLRRLKQLSIETKALTFKSCPMQLHEKLETLFGKYSDPIIRSLSRKVGREREYESRILNGANAIITREKAFNDDDYKFVLTLTKYLPDHYLDNIDVRNISRDSLDAAIKDVLNPDKIGSVYYSTDWNGEELI